MRALVALPWEQDPNDPEEAVVRDDYDTPLETLGYPAKYEVKDPRGTRWMLTRTVIDEDTYLYEHQADEQDLASEDVGSVWLDKAAKCWRIKCELHVMRLLKRVFERIPKETPDGVAPLADTPENCKTLAWFLLGQPMTISDDDADYLRVRAEGETRRLRSVAKVLAGKYEPTTFRIAVPPYSYQYLPAELCLASGGLLCGDEVGVGKSLEGALLISDPRARPSLLVVPPNLIPQWLEKLQEYLPGIRVHVLKTGTPYALPSPFPDVLVCSISKLAGWSSALAKRVKSVVYDEVHSFCHEWAPPKEPGAPRERIKKYEAALYLRDHVDYVMGLTGTPIKNYGGEVRVVMNIIQKDALGTPKEFGLEWANGCQTEKAVVTDPKRSGRT
jgi:SNF2-related domain